MTTTENTAIEIVVPEREQLPPSLLSNIETGFRPSFQQAEQWREKALAIQITSIHQKDKMKEAREARLELRDIRIAGEKKHKELKADFLLAGRAIDGVKNLLLAAIVPLERHLEEQEKFAERMLEQQRQALIAERTEAIRPFIPEGQPLPALELMDGQQWEGCLADAKTLHAAKIEAAKRAEAERIAKEQAEAAERERLRIELERLRKEAVEREAAAKAEREAAEKAQREAAAKAKAERDALEAAAKAEREAAEKAQREAAAKAKAERDALEAAAKAEREAAEKAQREAAAKAKAERDALEAAAKAEREAAERELARIKAEAEAAAKKEQEARAKLEAELAAKRAAEERAAADAAAAQKKAARAPDKQKALTFAATVRTLKTPEATTAEGKAVMAEITAKIESFAKWIETQASNL